MILHKVVDGLLSMSAIMNKVSLKKNVHFKAALWQASYFTWSTVLLKLLASGHVPVLMWEKKSCLIPSKPLTAVHLTVMDGCCPSHPLSHLVEWAELNGMGTVTIRQHHPFHIVRAWCAALILTHPPPLPSHTISTCPLPPPSWHVHTTTSSISMPPPPHTTISTRPWQRWWQWHVCFPFFIFLYILY